MRSVKVGALGLRCSGSYHLGYTTKYPGNDELEIQLEIAKEAKKAIPGIEQKA